MMNLITTTIIIKSILIRDELRLKKSTIILSHIGKRNSSIILTKIFRRISLMTIDGRV